MGNNRIRPVRYLGEAPLRNAPSVIGARIDRGHFGVYEVTRIEPNGLCFGIDIKYLEEWRTGQVIIHN